MPSLLQHRQTSRSPIHLSAVGKTTPKIVPALPIAGTSVSPSMAPFLRPMATTRWMLPYLAAITPQYVETLLRGAIFGNHVQAWELFNLMIDTDPEIASCYQEYCEGVLRKKIVFEPLHNEDEEPSDLATEKHKLIEAAFANMRPRADLDENDLRGTMNDLLAARFHNQSVCEADYYDDEGKPFIRQLPDIGNVWCPRATYWVHPVCYGWDTTGKLGLRMDPDAARTATAQIKTQKGMATTAPWTFPSGRPAPADLFDIPLDKFLIGVHKAQTGTVLQGSCLRPLAWWWVASNFCGDFLLNLAQLFGIPFRKATYGTNVNVDQQTEIRQMLQSCGSCGYILLPDGADVEFMKGGEAAGQSPQAFLFHFADSQKRKVILHQTMTGGQHDSMGKGGGKAFGEVEADTKAECIGAGCSHVERVINLQWIPTILKLNYGEDGDLEAPVCRLVDASVGGLTDAQRDTTLATVMNIPTKYMHRKYGIPKPGPGDEIAGVDGGTTGAAAQAAEKAQKVAAQTAQANAKTAQANKQSDAGTGSDDDEAKQVKQDQQDERAQAEARAHLEAEAAEGSSGCLMAMLPALDSALPQWAGANVPVKSLTGDGIETRPHVTVLYGFNPDLDFQALKQAAAEPMTLTIGKAERFRCQDYDVLIFEVQAPALERLHEQLAHDLKDQITPSEYEYHPHLTVAYVKRGALPKFERMDNPFTGQTLTVRQLLYSDPNKTESVIDLHNQVEASAATALADTAEPMLARLRAIARVEDPDTRKTMLQKFLADHGKIAAAMLHDDSVAREVSTQSVSSFVKAMNKPAKETTP